MECFFRVRHYKVSMFFIHFYVFVVVPIPQLNLLNFHSSFFYELSIVWTDNVYELLISMHAVFIMT